MLSLAITRPGWTLGVVPLSHLPLLLIEPRISGPLVHVGLAGLATWSLTVIAATAWCVVALQCARAERVVGQSTSPPAPVSWIHWGPPVAALVIWGAFLVPIMSAPASPDSSGSVTAALMGLLVSMWVGFRWFGVELTDVQRDPRERARLRTQLLLRRRFSPQVFWTAASLSLVLGIVAALVYGAT